MTNVSDEQLIEHLNWRAAVKKFDPQLKVGPAQFRTIEEAFRLAPSSYGVSPWHFVVVTDQAVKDKLPDISHGQQQPKDCSHVVVVAVRRDYTDSDLSHLVDRMAAVTGKKPEDLAGFRKVVAGDALAKSPQAKAQYLERQTYISLGFGLLAAAMLGIDAAPMEGIDYDAYDRQFKLTDQGYRALCIVCFGYRLPDDPYLKRPKVRFAHEDVFTHIEKGK